MTEAKNGGKYEGYLESPCTCILSLKRVYNTIIKYIKYIFSERTIHCRFVGTFKLKIFFTLMINIQTWY